MPDQSLPDLPTHFETERLYVRRFQPGDGPWYYAASQKNRQHLLAYEADNVVMGIESAEEAEGVVRDLGAEWEARRSFFMAAFGKKTGDFVAQLYVGPVDWNLPEFQIGYFVDRDYEGQGYVTEAVKAALRFIFENLKAHRVSLECADTNARSYRVAERCGMVLEGHFREKKRNAEGAFSGTLHYALLRSEFDRLAGTADSLKTGKEAAQCESQTV